MATTQEEYKSEDPEFDIPFQPVGGSMDTNKIYKWSEACSIRDTFIRMIVTHSGDPKSWFSAYRIQKKSWANANIGVLDREKLLSMHFETHDQVILFMERVFKAMGYEILRRDSFDMIQSVPPAYLLADADYMTSLLASEYEWETSLKYFQSKGQEYGPAKYKIMDDAMFTPQTTRANPTVIHEAMEALQGDAVMRTVEASVKKPTLPAQVLEVQKTLDFNDVSSTDTTPNTKPKPKKPVDFNENLAQGLLKLATDGDLSLDDAMKALRTLKVSQTTVAAEDVGTRDTTDEAAVKDAELDAMSRSTKEKTKKPKEKKTAVKKSGKSAKKPSKSSRTDTEGSATDDTDRGNRKKKQPKKQARVRLDVSSESSEDDTTARKTRSRRSRAHSEAESSSSSEASSDDDGDWADSDLVGQDLPFRGKRKPGMGAAIMQNIQLRVFDGRSRSVEEGVQWASKLIYAANMTNMTETQRLEAFVNNIGGPVRFWWKQLPKEVRRSWKKTLKAFHKRYCRDALSVQRSYFKMFQRQDEKPVDYLYRLNAAAIKAGIDYEDDPKELSEHIELFFDTAIEKSLPAQLRYNTFKTAQELERVLIQHETTQSKNAKKASPAPVAQAPKADKPRVNVVEAPSTPTPAHQQNQLAQAPRQAQPTGNNRGGGGNKPRCDTCDKTGHTTESCWRDIICEHCSRKGHPARVCRRQVDELIALREQVRNGDLTAEQLIARLN